MTTQESEKADRTESRGGRQREAGCGPMTAFKSDSVMHLHGSAAKRWVEKIKKEKAEQDERERETETRSEQNGSEQNGSAD
jgi:hypothetical protein